MSYHVTTEPTEHERTLPIQEAIAKVALRLLGDRADPEIERAIRNATIALVPAYVPPERPIDVIVTIADETGHETEHEVHLTREQAARPELLGAAVGGAAAAVLRGFHVVVDDELAQRALEAAKHQLRDAP